MSSPHSFVRRLLAVALIVACASVSRAQDISPLLVGNNLWHASRNSAATTPSAQVMSLATEAGIRLIRIGGHEFDERMPSNAALLIWVDRIRAAGAEPLIQVSQYQSAALAASAVTHLNVTHGRAVRYWSIGNEPWLQANRLADAAGVARPSEAEIATAIAIYFKDRAAAMKAVDPTIKIFGPDSEDLQTGLHARLFGGSSNIAGLVPGQNYYYCDGLAWHRYPQTDGIDPAFEGLADIRTRIEKARALVDATNLSQNRTGDSALLWAIGEFNSKNGPVVHTWGNGQMFGAIFGLAMKHGAAFAAPWSLRESDGARTATDFGLLDGAGFVPRPTFWHTQFVARHFTGRYLEGSPSVSNATSDLLVYGAADDAHEQVGVMILNRGFTARPYTLHLDSSTTFAAPGATALTVNAARPDSRSDTLPPRATDVLVFRRDSITRIRYTNDDFEAALPPQTTVFPRSPVAGLIDDFDSYSDLAQQRHWSALHINGGGATIDAGQLVLRTSHAAYSAASLAGPVSAAHNFFQRSFTVSLPRLALSSDNVDASATHFRISLNSSRLRSFRADDSLALRITPTEARFGYKLDQPDAQGEIRAGSASTDASLERIPLTAAPESVHLALDPDPAYPVSGVSTIHYTLRLDGPFGRVLRTGSFVAAAADWGANGDSALVLEARREATAAGRAGSFVEARLDSVAAAPRLLDGFDTYATLADQTYWKSLFVGTNSTAQIAFSSAVLLARADAFASAALACQIAPEFNFFDTAFTVELRDLALVSAGLTAGQSVFRLSLASTSARSFTSPDALTLRLNPDRLVLGYKLDQPSADAEFRIGAPTTPASLLDLPLDPAAGPVTGLRLTLAPVGPHPSLATEPATIFYALQLTRFSGELTRSGTFAAPRSTWGATGDSSLVLEARRNSGAAGTTATLMQATVGAIGYTVAADDHFATAPHFAAWRLRGFAFADLADATLTGPLAAPLGDGLPHLLKYAMGLDSTTPATGAALSRLPSLHPVAGLGPVFIHEERAATRDLVYQVEASTDLATWTTPVIEVVRAAPDAEGWSVVTTRADLPADPPRVFLRLRVTVVP